MIGHDYAYPMNFYIYLETLKKYMIQCVAGAFKDLRFHRFGIYLLRLALDSIYIATDYAPPFFS